MFFPPSAAPVAVRTCGCFTELLKTHKLSHRSVHIQPRGLTNRGNWCYVNAVSFMHTAVFDPLHAVCVVVQC